MTISDCTKYGEFKAFLHWKHGDKQLSQHFWLREFNCKCDSINCAITLVAEPLLKALQDLREKLGEPIIITSAFRCQEHNRKAGGSETSCHLVGLAADIKAKNMDLLYTLAKNSGAGGIGRYNRLGVLDRLHIDFRKSLGQPIEWILPA